MENNINTQGVEPTVESNTIPLGEISVEPTVNTTPETYMAFTLSADPNRDIGRSKFHELSPTEQKKVYYYVMKEVFTKYKDKYGMREMYIHYELDKKQKIHAHGWVDVKETIVDYEVPKLEIQSLIHKKIGRKGNFKSACACIKYIKTKQDKIKWVQYCTKEDVLKASKIIRHNISDYCK